MTSLDLDNQEDDDVPYKAPKPWDEFYEKTRGHIVCDESSESRMHFYMGIIFYGVSYYISTQFLFDDPRDDVFIYAIRGVPLAIATLFFFLGIKAYIRTKKFGISTCIIKNDTGILGGSLSGTIQSTSEIHPSGDYKITLECIEKKVNTQGSENSRPRYNTIWKGKASVPSNAVSSRAGIPFSFSIPSNVPPSNFLGGDGHIRWALKIEAPTPGFNYKAQFSVPVFRNQ